jgi:hypothetical protein
LRNKLLEKSRIEDRHVSKDKRYLAIPTNRINKLNNISRYEETETKRIAAHDAKKKMVSGRMFVQMIAVLSYLEEREVFNQRRRSKLISHDTKYKAHRTVSHDTERLGAVGWCR